MPKVWILERAAIHQRTGHLLVCGNEEFVQIYPTTSVIDGDMIVDRSRKVAGKHFLVTRSDGLGARLQAMLNAIILANRFGVDFRFTWSEKKSDVHAVPKVTDTFSPEFVKEHYLPKHDHRRYTTLVPKEYTIDEVGSLLERVDDGVIVHHSLLNQLFHPQKLDDIDEQYALAFHQIQFSLPVAEVISRGKSVDIPPESVAIHLRAGDIVYGGFRFLKQFNRKVLPYPVAKRAISNLMDQGKYPILFGQDHVTCSILAKKFGLRLGSDFLPLEATASNLQRAVLDLTLMSRCEKIFSGSSAFSVLAGLAGNRQVIDPRRLWKDKEVVDTILTDDDLASDACGLPALQRSFSYFSAVHAGENYLGIKERLGLLDKAIADDPENSFYSLLKATLQLENGRPDLADHDLLLTIDRNVDLGRPIEKTAFFNVLNKRISSAGGLAMKEYVDKLREFALPQYPGVSYVSALMSLVEGKHDVASKLIANCRSLGERATALEELIGTSESIHEP